MTWIERTAYPQFKRLTSARVLHVFFTPSSEEVAWAEQRTGSPESCFALVLALKCFQKMARFPSPNEIPEVVIDHVRRCLELPEDVWQRPGPRSQSGGSDVSADAQGCGLALKLGSPFHSYCGPRRRGTSRR